MNLKNSEILIGLLLEFPYQQQAKKVLNEEKLVNNGSNCDIIKIYVMSKSWLPVSQLLHSLLDCSS
jgi:hypothetical protein